MSCNFKAIEYLKSGLSIQTHIGCKIGCKYCIVESFYDDVNKVNKVISPEELVEKTLKHKFYNENVPILINNKTEALQGEVKDSTYKILELLKYHKVKNPKILITKLPVSFDDLDALDNNNLFIFTTYSGMPKEIERTSTDSNLKKIAKSNKRIRELTDAKLIHYFRPIVRNVNSSDEILSKSLRFGAENFDCSIVSGVRLTLPMKSFFEGYGADFSDWHYDIEHKFLPNDIFEKLKELKSNISEEYPIFKKTSCAISYLLNKRDYNKHYNKPVKVDCINCSNYKNCSKNISIDNTKVVRTLEEFCLDDIYELVNDKITLDGTLDQETVSYIKHTTGCSVVANKKTRSYTEEIFYEKNRISS